MNSPVKFLNPRTVYVGILKYVPILEFHFNLRSLLIEYDVEILGDRVIDEFGSSTKTILISSNPN